MDFVSVPLRQTSQGAKGNATQYDGIVVGAGPAGLMAGITAAQRGLAVLILEKMDKPCRKLLISGKGRCNIANAGGTDAFFSNIRNGAKFLQSSYRSFDCDAVTAFFERQGILLKTERGNRVFPQSDRAQDIADALVGAAKNAGCVFRKACVQELLIRGGSVVGVRLQDKTELLGNAVIVATGGVSYPRTGSSGDGYRFARQAGHTIIPPHPSLVPLVCAGTEWSALQGLSLRNVRLTAARSGREIFGEQGEMLFTHFGVSGPMVLSMSARLVQENPQELDIAVDLKPALDIPTLDRRILSDFAQNRNREFRNSLGALLPRALIGTVVARSGIDPRKKIHSVTAAERAALIQVLKRFSLPVIGTRPVEEAIVTAGGVSLAEIDPRTMMSKKVRQLYVIGEVLDADGLTGGFNFGIAFATGAAAGRSIPGGSLNESSSD